MAYEKVYSRINWENEPSTKSPINEENLNKIDFALNEIDNRTVELSGYESIVIDYSNQAKTSATNALSSETKAKTSEQNSYAYEQSALTSKNQAEVFKNEAETHANNASASERNAKLSEYNASASELLAKNSEENASGFSESAKTSAQKAKASEDIAVASASSAKTDSDLAKSYTVGTHGEVRENDDTDNAKYYYEQTKGISQSLSGALKPMGTIVFDNLPSSPNSGDMYNISNEFITDDRFKEGSGKTMPIGTNVYFTEDGYWDCLAGSPVTGVKGSNEISYRQGNVEITPNDLGLSTVATSGSYNDLSDKPTIPSVGNGTITITQNGATKGTFTTNQSGNTTIALTDNNTTYEVATSSALGLVKSGTDITVDSSGNVSVNDDSHNHIISNVDGLQIALDGKAASSHTHNYAGSSSAGGSATSAVKLDSSAGSAKQPVYFSGGKPVACTYTLGDACAYGISSAPTISETGLVPTSHAVANALSNKLGQGNIANNLTTTSSGYVLDARQGKALGDRVSTLETWTKSGNWYYRKVGSIVVNNITKYIYDCHYKATHSVATTSSYGNMYYNSTSVNISYPLSGRIGTLSQTATVKAGNGLFFVNINDYTSEDVWLWIASAKSGTYDIEINLHCFIY